MGPLSVIGCSLSSPVQLHKGKATSWGEKGSGLPHLQITQSLFVFSTQNGISSSLTGGASSLFLASSMVRFLTTISTVERVSHRLHFATFFAGESRRSLPGNPLRGISRRFRPGSYMPRRRTSGSLSEFPNRVNLSCFSPFWPVQYSFTVYPVK